MTEEELEEYSQLNANEQIEKVEDLVKNLGGKYADIFATYKDVFYRTKPEAFEKIRKLLIDDIISMRQNYEKRKLGVLVKENINYVNKELANQFDDMIFILLQGKNENETNQIKQEYITKYIKEKNLIAAFSSGGNSPVLAQYLKSQEKEILTPFLGELNEYMGKIRKRVIEKYDTEEKRKEIFKEIVNTAIENGELPQE